jgi:hypothetical protein
VVPHTAQSQPSRFEARKNNPKPKIIFEKSLFNTSKVKIRQSLVWEIAGSTQKHNKMAETPNQPIKSKK